MNGITPEMHPNRATRFVNQVVPLFVVPIFD